MLAVGYLLHIGDTTGFYSHIIGSVVVCVGHCRLLARAVSFRCHIFTGRYAFINGRLCHAQVLQKEHGDSARTDDTLYTS